MTRSSDPLLGPSLSLHVPDSSNALLKPRLKSLGESYMRQNLVQSHKAGKSRTVRGLIPVHLGTSPTCWQWTQMAPLFHVLAFAT